MPKNYFTNREKRSMDPNKVHVGDFVFIVEKQKQGAKSLDELQLGVVKQKLSNGDLYKNGAKVMIAPLSKETRKIIKPYIDKYYKDAILNFNNENVNLDLYIDELNENLDKLGIDLRKECEEYSGELIVGRIQYYLYPENYKPKPKISIIKLGLSNNTICTNDILRKQLDLLKSNYYINCKDYEENINKLIRFRTLINTFDITTLKQMKVYPNYCEITVEDNESITNIKYFEIDY